MVRCAGMVRSRRAADCGHGMITAMSTAQLHMHATTVSLCGHRVRALGRRPSLLRLHFESVSAPALLPAPAPDLHMSAPVRRGTVADARLGLA